MADGPRISDSLDPRSLVPDERAVAGGALRSGGRQNKSSQQAGPTSVTAGAHLPGKPWYRGWPAAATAGVVVVVAASAVAVAANSGGHAKPAAQVQVTTEPVARSAPPLPTGGPTTNAGRAVSLAPALPALPAANVGASAPATSAAVRTQPVQWHVVAVVRSIGPTPKRQNPFDVIEGFLDNIHAGQRFEETVTCATAGCLPPSTQKFVVGQTLAYWGLAGEGNGLKTASVPTSHSCQGQKFTVQPGYTATLTQTSATSYTSTLSRPALDIPTACGGRPYHWLAEAYVVDRTITQVP